MFRSCSDLTVDVYASTLRTNSTKLHCGMRQKTVTRRLRGYCPNMGQKSAHDKDYSTPLHRASFVGEHEVVRLMLDHRHGANVDAKDKDGKSPLHLVFQERREVVLLLLYRGANADAKDNHGRASLHLTQRHPRGEPTVSTCCSNEARM